MKIILSIVVLSSFLCACNQSEENTSKKTETVIENKDSTGIIQNNKLAGCYRMVISNDTALMHIEQKGDSITGSLVYKRKEKDSNTGNVSLAVKGNRAEGWYTFMSEGKTSVRQIILKINGDTFAEGYGDIMMKNDSAVFKYPHALNFEEKHTFNKIRCP